MVCRLQTPFAWDWPLVVLQCHEALRFVLWQQQCVCRHAMVGCVLDSCLHVYHHHGNINAVILRILGVHAGQYGGRKVLSRAFRSRFLELHVGDLPDDELEFILQQRCALAPSYSKKLVGVMRDLYRTRQVSACSLC